MLIQERVLAAKPEAMILAVAQLFCLPASDTFKIAIKTSEFR
jgi:hypothetical protein